MISYDLYRSILEYLPVGTLKKLSNACPMFDEVIYAMDIRAFCWNGNICRLGDLDTIIVASNGKKYLLHKFMRRSGNGLADGYEIINGDRFTVKPIVIKYSCSRPAEELGGWHVYYDHKNETEVIRNKNDIHINEYKRSRVHDGSYVETDISCDFRGYADYIDFESKIVIWFAVHVRHNTYSIVFDHFTVLFAGNDWIR